MRNPIVILVSCFLLCFLMNLDLYSQVPLAYSITLEKRDRVKKTLTFKAVIRNVSKSDLIIDRKGLFYELEVRKFANSPGDGIFLPTDEFTSILSHGHTPDYLRLSPQAVFTDKRTLPLVRLDILEKGRSYAVFFKYGQFMSSIFEDIPVWKGTVRSNVIKFKL